MHVLVGKERRGGALLTNNIRLGRKERCVKMYLTT